MCVCVHVFAIKCQKAKRKKRTKYIKSALVLFFCEINKFNLIFVLMMFWNQLIILTRREKKKKNNQKVTPSS